MHEETSEIGKTCWIPHTLLKGCFFTVTNVDVKIQWHILIIRNEQTKQDRYLDKTN